MRSAFASVWLLASLAWLHGDRIVRDGDEEGHVGAAELMRLHLDGGAWLQFFQDAWRGDLGEYPPLYPAFVAVWWWLTGSGQPGEVAVRSINLAGVLLAAWATSAIAGRLHAGRGYTPHAVLRPERVATFTTFVLVLTLPLANGLSRHFMPEGLLVGWVALAVCTATWAADRRDPTSVVALGAVLGLGMLVKQTFLPLALLPVAVAGAGLRVVWLPVVCITTAIAAPWYVSHWADQSAYVTQSVQAGPNAGALAHLAYYPAIVLQLAAGPVAVLAGLLGIGLAARAGRKGPLRGLAIGVAWIVGIAFLVVIPKKYPRLAAPIAPAFALLAGLGAAHIRQRAVLPAAATTVAVGWLTWTSLSPPQPAAWVPVVDEKCPQQWLRPPNPDDLGLAAIAEALTNAPLGPLAVAHAPEIPCAVQTTHPWASHIEPYLRRAGIERQVVMGTRASAAVQATFLPVDEAMEGDLPVPSLNLVLRIETH